MREKTWLLCTLLSDSAPGPGPPAWPPDLGPGDTLNAIPSVGYPLWVHLPGGSFFCSVLEARRTTFGSRPLDFGSSKRAGVHSVAAP